MCVCVCSREFLVCDFLAMLLHCDLLFYSSSPKFCSFATNAFHGVIRTGNESIHFYFFFRLTENGRAERIDGKTSSKATIMVRNHSFSSSSHFIFQVFRPLMVKIGLVLLSLYALVSLTIPAVNFLFPTAIRHLVFMNIRKAEDRSALFITLSLISPYSGQSQSSGIVRSRSCLSFLLDC